MAEIEWRPGPELLKRSRLLRFMREQGYDAGDYAAFHAWTIREPAAFWDAVMVDLDLQFLHPYRETLDVSRGPQWPQWFRGGVFNYVHSALDRRLPREAERTCLIWEGDDGQVEEWTLGRLSAEVQRIEKGLRSLGLRKGDRVGIFMPMTPQTVAATLAVNRMGAIYIPIFSGYGPEAMAQRLQDSGARLLITADGFLRRGRSIPMKATADAALAGCPGVEQVLVYRRLGEECPWTPGRDVDWADFPGTRDAPPCEPTDPEDPCLLIYTSGTTGRPKGAVHPHCGFPVKAAQDLAHLFDLEAGDRLFWYSDLGWMMGPWAIMGSLLLGATCVIFEGTPDFPDPGRIWRMVERHRVTHLGISPTAIRALMPHGDHWPGGADLSSLVVLGSSGEPWNEGPWRWFLQQVGGGRCPIINYSGGTEISGGILGCVTFKPLKPCSFNAVVPGMDADVLDPSGRPVRNQVGELVLRGAWPGITRGFWGDPDRYLDTYWSRWPGVWVHGDWALRDQDDDWYILGRSDDTIKIAGKRLGPAEAESAAIGVPDALKGENLVIFVVPAAGASDEEACRGAAEEVEGALGKALRPAQVYSVSELPRTRNGKILRRVLRATFLGEPPGDLGSLENPASLESLPRLARQE